MHDYIYSTYNTLLDAGWRFDDIDRMDILGFLKVRAWKAKQAKEKEAPRQRYIDEVWPRVVP